MLVSYLQVYSYTCRLDVLLSDFQDFSDAHSYYLGADC
jgi:hypothetical protein